MFLSLEGEVRHASLELEEDVISSKDGVKIIVVREDKLCKKDVTLSKFQALETFETYKRHSNTSIIEYINDFEKCHQKVNNYGAQMSDDVFAYRLIKNTNLK